MSFERCFCRRLLAGLVVVGIAAATMSQARAAAVSSSLYSGMRWR